MTIYLIKKDGTFDTFTNVIEWTENSVTYKAGKGIAKIYANDGEYFTNQSPETEKPIEEAQNETNI